MGTGMYGQGRERSHTGATDTWGLSSSHWRAGPWKLKLLSLQFQRCPRGKGGVGESESSVTRGMQAQAEERDPACHPGRSDTGRGPFRPSIPGPVPFVLLLLTSLWPSFRSVGRR